MKKTLALILSFMLAAGVFASCGKNDKKEENNNPSQTITDNAEENKEESIENGDTATVDTSAYTVNGIIESIYKQKAPLFPTGFMPLDMTDKDSYFTYLGLEDVSSIKEAAVSESMMGAQAYSLVVARVNDGENAAEIAENMKNGINPRKWVCVGADDIKYTVAGDLICFCMISSDYKDAFTADDAMNAFTKIVNGEAEYVEAPAEEAFPEETPNEIPEADVTDGVIPEDGNTETAPEDNKANSPEAKGEEKPEQQDDKRDGAPSKSEIEESKPADAQKPMQNPEEIPAQPEEVPAETPIVPEEIPASPEMPAEPEQIPSETPADTSENTTVTTPEEAPVQPEEAPTESSENISLDGIISKMYEIKAPQFMLGFIPVDMTDEFAYSTYLGIKDPAKIAEAVVSEPMIGAQAYSLVVARVAEGQDANAIAAEMKAGINPRKWVCVEADDIKVTVEGNLICFCMISSDFAEDYTADDAINAFKSVAK